MCNADDNDSPLPQCFNLVPADWVAKAILALAAHQNVIDSSSQEHGHELQIYHLVNSGDYRPDDPIPKPMVCNIYMCVF